MAIKVGIMYCFSPWDGTLKLYSRLCYKSTCLRTVGMYRCCVIVTEAFLFRDSTITTVVPAVAALLDPGLLKCVVDPSYWCMQPEVAHACPPLDQCTGSGVTHAWTVIGRSLPPRARGNCRDHRKSRLLCILVTSN